MKKIFRSIIGNFLAHVPGHVGRKYKWDYLRQRIAISDSPESLRKLLPFCEISEEDVKAYFQELFGYVPLRDTVEAHKAVIGKDFQAKMSGVVVAANLFCYVAIRILKPDVIVETGCATGWNSSLFLLALHRNQRGRLFSIDIPAVAGQYSMDWTLPSELKPGFLVPDELRTRWTLILGDARAELIPLLEKQDKIDVFFHDSDHTYQHMMWEYRSAWPYLSERGLLISDDVGWNTAFYDFADAMRRPIVVHANNLNFGAMTRGANR